VKYNIFFTEMNVITRFLNPNLTFSANVEVEDFTWSLFTLFGAENSIGMLGSAIARKNENVVSCT
jgi:hypothetical protein